ncbi:major tail protein [Lentibacillus saliphilus]|uniref:major tail protein n=1 Tax=Lentibacillus saliphilus TaxID=2737028 RepID=UPI001C309148|nr:major tail protein [Lentibacillus saliphilus]
MSEQKYYKSATGVDEFYYSELDETGAGITLNDPELVDFAQTINIEMPQDSTRAYGSNKTAEIAVSSGDVSVTAAFHRIPEQDKQRLFGLEKTETGLYAYGSNDSPPYVGVVFAKTFEDGSKEYVGLPKGMFMRPNQEAKTKEGGGVEFSNEETSAEFMDRKVAGFDEEKTVIFGRDAKGSTTARDAIFQAVFGRPYPSTPTTTTTTSGAGA